MKERTKRLLASVNTNHDWDRGQTWGGGGTRLSRTDVCRCCDLQRHWFSDTQNDVESRYTFTIEGDEIPLVTAAALQCCQEEGGAK